MFSLNESHRFHLCTSPVDLRKGFDSLSGLVMEYMGGNPTGGNVFIFINKSRTSIKLLHWERGGLVVYHKRLESGRFTLPVYDEAGRSFPLHWHDLVLLIEGISLEKVRYGKRYKLPLKSI